MPYKDPEKKREADREWYRKQKEKSTRSEPVQNEIGIYSDEQIEELKTADGLCSMLAKHILILDTMPLEAVIKAKAISTLVNTAGRIIANRDMEKELDELKAEVMEIVEKQRRAQ